MPLYLILSLNGDAVFGPRSVEYVQQSANFKFLVFQPMNGFSALQSVTQCQID